jgi:hypothetical protein
VSGTQVQAVFGLDDTWASFTSITTTDPSGKLSGTLFPVPAGGSVTVQSQTAGAWRTVGQAPVSASGAYSTQVPSGRYRVVDGGLDGPVVTVP